MKTQTPVPQFQTSVNIAGQLANNRLRPTMEQMSEALKRPIRYRLIHGKRTPYIPLQQNDGPGKASRAGHVVQEMVGPWAKAEIERKADLYGWPGGYAGRGKPRGLAVCKDFCPECDLLLVWCECSARLGLSGTDVREAQARSAQRRAPKRRAG